MSFEIRSIAAADQWEPFVLANAPYSLFQSWSWGEVQQRLGNKTWRFGFYDKGKLSGIFTIYKVLARRGTFFHVRHGPILVPAKLVYWRYVFNFLRDLGKREGIWFIRISPLISDTVTNQNMMDSLGLVPAAIHAMDGEICWVLDLDKSEEELLAGMRKGTRYEIRRGMKMGIQIVKSTDLQDLGRFLALYRQTSMRQGFVPHRGLAEEFAVFANKNKAILIFASLAEKLLASAIILFWGGEAIYHHGASVPGKIPASYLVQWEAIKEAKKRGMKIYNFWGIAPEDKPNHPWAGITLFKTGFGGRQLRFLHVYDLPVSSWYGVSRIIEQARKLFKGY